MVIAISMCTIATYQHFKRNLNFPLNCSNKDYMIVSDTETFSPLSSMLKM